MAPEFDDSLDLDDVLDYVDGQVVSMSDPDTGETIHADQAPVPTAGKASGGAQNSSYDELEEADEESGQGNDEHDDDDAPLADVLADALSAYGFEDGDDAIEWDGQATRVRDLAPEDRREFFAQLREADRLGSMQELGLSEDEASVLNYLRQGGDLRDLAGVNSPAGESRVAGLDADGLNRLDIRQQFPGLTDEEVEQELEDRRGGRLYESKTSALRERLSTQEQAQQQQAAEQEFRQVQQQFVSAANQTQQIMGFPVAPEVREYLLQQTATQLENGNSPFMESLTPEKILHLQFLDTYLPQIQQHYEQQIKAAHQQGRREALEGAPATPSGRGGSAGNTRASAGSSTGKRNPANDADFTFGAD